MTLVQEMTDRAPALPPAEIRRRSHRFSVGMAVVFLAVVFIGFGPTYYWGQFLGAPHLQGLVHAHALIATCWCLLFLTQATLIATHRTRIHRKLGIAATVLAAALVISGYLAAVNSARLGHGPPGRNHVQFLAIPLGSLLMFSLFFVIGFWKRTDREVHKRCMVLATIGLMSAAFARIGNQVGHPGLPALFAGTLLIVLLALGWDWWATGRVHPVLLWGGLLLVLWQPLRAAISRTPAWMTFSRQLIGAPLTPP